jgi:hypothetical protein
MGPYGPGVGPGHGLRVSRRHRRGGRSSGVSRGLGSQIRGERARARRATGAHLNPTHTIFPADAIFCASLPFARTVRLLSNPARSFRLRGRQVATVISSALLRPVWLRAGSGAGRSAGCPHRLRARTRVMPGKKPTGRLRDSSATRFQAGAPRMARQRWNSEGRRERCMARAARTPSPTAVTAR